MLVVDMGVVGDKVQGDESSASICVKDSSGPYDYAMRCKLAELAKRNSIPYKLDVFPHYGSDGSAALAAGHDLRVALIGPGVSASHGMERTHLKGLLAARDLLLAYIKDYKPAH
jgi:putative aminopeptidase FrvX